jgi:hypothetical protein
VGSSRDDSDSRRETTAQAPGGPRSFRGWGCFEAIYDEGEDEIVLRRVKREQVSWLKVMKQCPVPMDDLPPRSREYSKKLKL